MKKIITGFLKDHLLFTAIYLCGCFFIILFYILLTKGEVETLYPVLISVFVYLIYLVIAWFRYYKFNRRLPNAVKNKDYELSPSTCEQALSQQTINGIHQYYTELIEETRSNIVDKDRFISEWVHNMKTPVSVISLILQKEQVGSDDLANIKEENEKLLNCLEQILNLYRLNEFSKDYIPEAADLTECVREVINSKKNQFIYHKVYPKFDVSEPVTVLTDVKWNKMMIGQFVSNAVKYSDTAEKPKDVWFKIERQGGNVLLTIRDEGMGIPEYDLDRIFDPFFTGENGRIIKNSSGIGLFICAEIAKKLGHKIDIQSKQGEGTTITVTYLAKL
jgi:two-component system, OmpR family, sensor histidine kinase YxdK